METGVAVTSPGCGWHSQDPSLVTNNDERKHILQEARAGVKYSSPLLVCEPPSGKELSGRVSDTPATQDLMHTLGCNTFVQRHALIKCYDPRRVWSLHPAAGGAKMVLGTKRSVLEAGTSRGTRLRTATNR